MYVMSKGLDEHRSRSFTRTMKRVTALTAGVTLASSAGCLGLFSPPPGSGAGGMAPGGAVPHRQEIFPQDAHATATSVGELQNYVDEFNDGEIVWLPNEGTYDLTGSDLLLENVTVASGRTEGQSGAQIISNDEGSNSPVWAGGSNDRGLIQLGDNARLTGVEVRGPHHSEYDHPGLQGYFPFAPQSSRSARDSWRSQRYARGVSIRGDNVSVDNCEIWAFSVQGIAVGSNSDTPTNTMIRQCAIHSCMMTSYGYAIDVRHGNPTVFQCYFDSTRHSMNGSGMADAGYHVQECTFGPWTASHQIDMHAVKDNVSGSSDSSARDYRHRAGGRMVVRGCVIMPTRVPDTDPINHNRGGSTPHVHIRAVPEEFYFINNTCGHSGIESGIRQTGVPGSYETNSNGFTNMHIEGNSWNNTFEAMQQVP